MRKKNKPFVKIETEETLLINAANKSITYNNHPKVPLFTVRAEAVYGENDRLIGRYSALKDAIDAYNALGGKPTSMDEIRPRETPRRKSPTVDYVAIGWF